MTFSNITQPTLILDPGRCVRNINRMIEKAGAQKVSLRPHFKTHQSHHIGRWFREEGIEKITTSSVGMTRYFALDGWEDITIAFPVNVRQLDEINALSTGVRLGLLVLEHQTVEKLGKHLRHEASIWIKIDVGTHRTGIAPDNTEDIDRILERIKSFPQLHFSGFLSHAGHSYQGRSVTEIQRIYDQSLDSLITLKRRYITIFPDLKISLGDTPGASLVDQFGPVDELRPGNFVFYDLMQEEIGACTMEEIAVAMACPVVAVHPERWQWIIYGGGIHFSKDFMTYEGDKRCFGRMADLNGDSWTTQYVEGNPYISSLSQEHGIVQCTEETFDRCRPGDLSLWLPVHSCLTADAMGSYITIEGELVDHYRSHVF